MVYRIAENFGGRKLWRIASEIAFGEENFGGFKPSLYSFSRYYKQLADKTLANL